MNYHRLFEVLNARENRKATIIAAQIPRSDWYDLFRNDTYADACMDRITKSNFLIELEGPSLRCRRQRSVRSDSAVPLTRFGCSVLPV